MPSPPPAARPHEGLFTVAFLDAAAVETAALLAERSAVAEGLTVVPGVGESAVVVFEDEDVAATDPTGSVVSLSGQSSAVRLYRVHLALGARVVACVGELLETRARVSAAVPTAPEVGEAGVEPDDGMLS